MSDRLRKVVSSGSAADNVALSMIAPAKLNLFLHVVGRRLDGYHLIQSLFAFASFGDQLTVSADRELRFELEGPFSRNLDPGDNLVLKAARVLARAADLGKPGAKIRLCKNLPVAAGLGGGSADAAAALHALLKHWDVEMTCENQLELALELGADVPACYVGRPIIASGIGEEMVPYENLPDIPLLLVTPGQEIHTHEVFAAFRQRAIAFSERVPDSWIADRLDVWDLLSRTQNDLEAVTSQLAPEVSSCLQVISKTSKCRLARMSGSGACCFGLYDAKQSADSAAEEIKSRYPDWWVQSGNLQGTLKQGNG
jgi:4-diphosphocytidyl-2-C-methyl-D-erythritol kinase